MGLNDNNSLKAMNSQQKSNYINMVANIVKDNVKVASFKILLISKPAKSRKWSAMSSIGNLI